MNASGRWLPHAVLLLGAFIFALPIWLAIAGATQEPGAIARGDLSLVPRLAGIGAFGRALTQTTSGGGAVWRMLATSFAMASTIAFGKLLVSVLSAFAVAFFRFPFRRAAFAVILLTLMLPVEVRLSPTYSVMAGLGLINRFTGLTLPLIASATATLLLRQVFGAVPRALADAARLDGAGPLRFLWHVLLPVSAPNLAALFVVLFVYGWNQYLWPLLVATDPHLDTIVVGLVRMIGTEGQTDWTLVMATTVLALLPPAALALLAQRWLVSGLLETEN